VVYDLEGTDRFREYIEIANLGTTPWDPRGHWLYRWAVRTLEVNDANGLLPQVMLQISGEGAANLQPIPPGGVLLVEWGRPYPDEDIPAQEGPNVFAPGRPEPIGSEDLQSKMALALFAPQEEPPLFPDEDPTFGEARMLAYYYQGAVTEDQGTGLDMAANIGMKRAAELGLWELGKAAPSGYDWATTLRWPAPAPGQPIPASIGRRAGDYYLTHYGLPSLSAADRARAEAGVVNPRLGTPGQPNLQFPGELIPGQTLANGGALLLKQVAATMATTTAGAPATAVHVAATNYSGAVATNLRAADNWAGWQFVGGPAIGKPIFADNPRTGARVLLVVDAITGQLYINRFAPSGSDPAAFQGWRPIGGKVSGTPAVAVDSATGNEAIVFNDPSGLTMVVTSENGVFGTPEPLPGDPKLTDVAVAYTPLGIVVLGYEGPQLVMSVQIQRAFTDLDNMGPPVANRAPIAPVIRYNQAAGRIEILTAGENGALSLTRVTATTSPTVSAPLPVGISTDSTPGMAVNTDTGDVMIIARSADRPIPEGERLNPTGGQARVAVLRNSSGAFDPSSRVGVGLMPPNSAPDVIYNAIAKQYEQFVVGEDFQAYRNVVGP
jgi:hypothetical protein